MLKDVGPLVDAGFALHLLRLRSKAPADAKWSSKPRATLKELRDTYETGNNIGVRLGEPSKIGDEYLYLIDVDIREDQYAADAMNVARKLLGKLDNYPAVVSGSGGHSRHFYFLSDLACRSRMLAHSVTSFVDSAGKKHWSWEIELFGTGKQAVLPPSVHPNGKRYRWEREFDMQALAAGEEAYVSAERIQEWIGAARPEDDDDDGFADDVKLAPLTLTRPEIEGVMRDLDREEWCEDRQGWLQVGMALHHQFEGSEEGYKIWVDFSKASEKFEPKVQRQTWNAFKAKPGGIRFATLLKAAHTERMRRNIAEMSDDDLIGEAPEKPVEVEEDILDLIGEAPEPTDQVAFDPNWKSKLAWNGEKTAIQPTLHNISLIVANDPRTRGVARLNEFSNEIVQHGVPRKRVRAAATGDKEWKQLTGSLWRVKDTVNGDLWREVQDIAYRDVLEAPTGQGGWAIKISDRDLRGAINLAADRDKFHPVRDYLRGLKWDRQPRVESLFTHFLGAENNSYHRSIARNFAVASVARIFEPGHKFDFAVILEGLQGKRKSTFIRILAKEWFSELDGDFHDSKTMVESMQGSWIIEIPELSGFGRSDVRTIKAFISRQSDKVRLAYERRAAVFPRQCVFIGSTNDKEYLRDDTGGRRFWPVETDVDEIDTEGLADVVDQFWAEAYLIYLRMRKLQPKGDLPLYLTDREAAAVAGEYQESRRVETTEDALAGQIQAWLESPMEDEDGFEETGAEPKYRTATCLIEIAVECIGWPQHQYMQNASQAQLVGRAMKRINGWTQMGHHRFDKYGFQRKYGKFTRK